MEIEEILKKAKGIKIDSREIKEGDIFIGIKGEKTDGSLFAYEAIKKGAIAAFVQKGFKKKLPYSSKIFEVKDTLEILWKIAEIKREMNKNIKVIGITGSTGKTTLKDLIYHFLKKLNKNVLKSKKSYNNFIGVPLTLCEIKKEHEYLVCEIGTNKKGEIEKLTKLVKPDSGIISKIGPVHIEFFGNLEEIFKEKIALFKNIKNPRYLIFNENSYGNEKIDKIFKNVILYNLERENYKIENDEVILNYKGIEFKYKGGGYPFLENLLCALKCMECEGFDIKELKNCLYDFEMPPLRMEKIQKDNITYVYDCYNSNPISIEALLKTYKNSSKRKILLIGDMLELGKYSEKYHREIANLAKENGISFIFGIGENTKYTVNQAKKLGIKSEHFESFEEIAKGVKEILIENDIVLIKGSRKMKMEKLKEYL